MNEERYPGERRGLTLFLEDLAPVVALQLGENCLLHHAIRVALRSASLQRLRHARRLFNHLPREVRQRLSEALLQHSAPLPSRELLLADYARRPPASVVAFESSERHQTDPLPQPELQHELTSSADLRVTIRPGTLPAVAAERLRAIADLIEQDRRLLSPRFWRQRQLGDLASNDQADCR